MQKVSRPFAEMGFQPCRRWSRLASSKVFVRPTARKLILPVRIFFRTQDLSEVKAYCERQWTNILVGAVSPQDFIFAKEVKLGSYR